MLMKKSKTFQNIKKMMKPNIKTIIIVTLLAIVVNIGEIIKPYIIKIIIDDYISLGVWEKGAVTIGILGVIYIGIVLIGNIIDFISQTATNRMGEKIIYQIRNDLYRYIENANISFHDKTPAGTLFVRITNDVEDISALFKDVITTFFKDIIMIIAILGIMIYISTKLSLLTFLLLPFIIFTSYIITKIINKVYEYSKVVRTKVNVFLAESIYGVRLIKIFNRQYEKQKECEKLNEEFWRSRLPIGFFTGILPAVMTILENLGISIVIWACVDKWFGIQIEVGVLYVFITYIKQIFEPINRIIENIETVQDSFVSIDKIYEILDHKEYLEDLEKGEKLEEIKGKIEFKNVWFAYEDENWVLKDVSFVIEPGQSIALVGKTGSGKTTITNLINRFYEIQKGEILIDGKNIKEINIHSLRQKIGTILQDPFIFAKSVRENIELNKKIEDEELEKAIEFASAEEFIHSLPKGLDEIAKEQGSSYSAGQKQLIAFARIFAHNPSIFILDEATANIDTNTEQLIQKLIDEISKNKTSIFIAHRLSTIVNVDKIIVLDHGTIIEQGNHTQLLKTGGYYSKLYQAYYTSLAAT